MTMRFEPSRLALPVLLGAVAPLMAPVTAHAKTYASPEEARHDMFGDAAATPSPVVLTSAQQDGLRQASSVSLPFVGNRIWKMAGGGWFIVDEVVGKHEMITYAVGLEANGTVRRVEVLEYRESYGQEVQEAAWLRQFVGKGASAPLKLSKDIENISGATLSSKHITDGVKRVLTLHDLVLKGL